MAEDRLTEIFEQFKDRTQKVYDAVVDPEIRRLAIVICGAHWYQPEEMVWKWGDHLAGIPIRINHNAHLSSFGPYNNLVPRWYFYVKDAEAIKDAAPPGTGRWVR